MTTSDLPDIYLIYRLPLRSQKEGGVPHDEQVEHCLHNGLSALGWGVEGGSLEEVLKQIEATYDRRGAQTSSASPTRRLDRSSGRCTRTERIGSES